MEKQATDVLVIGSGPAGALLGFLCARQGLRVTVLEKSQGFDREFRGEGISIGGVAVLERCGIFPKIDPADYVKVDKLRLVEDGKTIYSVDLGSAHPPHNFGIDMPQPTLLNLLVEESRRFPNYRFLSGARPVALPRDADGRVLGAVLAGEDGAEGEFLPAKIVVGCDGRYSAVRKLAGFQGDRGEFGRDVIWFKLPRPAGWDGSENMIRISGGTHLIILPCHPDLLRVGLYLPKGGFSAFKQRGIEALHAETIRLEPRFAGLVEAAVPSWKEATLLDIFTFNTHDWRQDGLVLIGDAAHTCSPVLGQGVNLALQDALELAPILAETIQRRGRATVLKEDLAGFMRARKRAISSIQRFQRQNETMLGYATPARAFLRRAFFRFLDASPVKVRLMRKIQMGWARPA